MDHKQATASGCCISCGRPVQDGRIICKCCEKCNDYSAARWLAKKIQDIQSSKTAGKE